MVDKVRRKKLAFHLRQLLVGQTTNDDFENGVGEDVSYHWTPEQYYRSKQAKSDDAAILAILELSWNLYSDNYGHKLTDKHQPPNEAIKTCQRSILFLQSNLEYEWPDFKFGGRLTWLDLLAGLLSLGFYFSYWSKKYEKNILELKKAGDFEVWPFVRKSDFEQQLKKPVFFSKIPEY